MAVNVKMSLVFMAVSLASLAAHVASNSNSNSPNADIDDIYWKQFCTDGFQERLDDYAKQLKDGKFEVLYQREKIVLNMYETRRRSPQLCKPERIIRLNEIVAASPESCAQYLEDQIALWSEDCMEFEYYKLIGSKNEELKWARNILEFLYGKAGNGALGSSSGFQSEVATHLAEYFSDPSREFRHRNQFGIICLISKKDFVKIFDEHVEVACEKLIKKTESMLRFGEILLRHEWQEEEWPEQSLFWIEGRRICENILKEAELIRKYLNEKS